MARDLSYAAVMARKNEIMKASLGIDFQDFIQSPIAFDYERMMRETGFSHEDIRRIQRETKVGDTPLFELTNLTKAVRAFAGPGKGAPVAGRSPRSRSRSRPRSAGVISPEAAT